ncbi:MAG TPA: transposase, partial [Bacteroidota bacterium]|nr:transposase [Bacteroidota bacterium]
SRREFSVSRHGCTCEQFSKPVAGSLSTVIRSFKSAASNRIHAEGYTDFAWQSRFYEHIIRGGSELDRIRAYIARNVEAWAKRHELKNDPDT